MKLCQELLVVKEGWMYVANCPKFCSYVCSGSDRIASKFQKP